MSIIIIEDDRVVTETLQLYLEQAGFSVAVAHDGRQGLELALRPDAQLLVLDLMIPGLPGQEVCRRVRAQSSVPILMLTARTSEDDRVAGLDLGADDYVPKPFRPREVVARIQALLRRTSSSNPVPPPIAVDELEVDTFARQARVSGRPVSLTPTEFRLLEVLARNPGRVFSREELVGRVFGPDFDGFDRTVDVHITNLRKKLDDNSRRWIATVHGIGYRFGGSHD
jgi:two-component system, OmpR family, alkaline phosphatase synthesis response regulator PhoP